MGDYVRAGDAKVWTEQVGEGPDVLLIGGLGDTIESWQHQLDGLADSYRLAAFDNRGAGRTAKPEGARVGRNDGRRCGRCPEGLRHIVPHVAGFSGGSVIAQELALRHPQAVRSLVLQGTWSVMNTYLRTWALFMRWLVEVAPNERAFHEGHFLFTYTPRSYNDGPVGRIIDDLLAFPHKQSTADIHAFIDAFISHDTTDRLPSPGCPRWYSWGAMI